LYKLGRIKESTKDESEEIESMKVKEREKNESRRLE